MRAGAVLVAQQTWPVLASSAGMLLRRGKPERRSPRWCRGTSPCMQLTGGAPGCSLGADQEDAVRWVVSTLVILLLESVELLA